MCQDESYSVVLDKGTVDALMTEDTVEVRERMDEMLGEVERVLRLGGRFVTVSLLQPHILHHLVHWSLNMGWPIRYPYMSNRFSTKS